MLGFESNETGVNILWLTAIGLLKEGVHGNERALTYTKIPGVTLGENTLICAVGSTLTIHALDSLQYGIL